jgi:hypothetical protein
MHWLRCKCLKQRLSRMPQYERSVARCANRNVTRFTLDRMAWN